MAEVERRSQVMVEAQRFGWRRLPDPGRDDAPQPEPGGIEQSSASLG